MFDLIDRIVSMDLGQRGMGRLYEAARSRAGAPLSRLAAEPLLGLAPGDRVMMLTGSIVRGWVSPALAETDGPIGAAALARTLSYGFNAIPVVLTDPSLMPAVTATLEVAGLTVVDLEHAQASTTNARFTGIAVVDTCGTDHPAARADAGRLLDRYAPRALLSIERAGMTADGTFRNSVGQDTGAGRALLDYVVREAQARGIPTVGIGDFGNEIGMGGVRAEVERYVPNGALICADLATDVVFPVGVSNWGCYAIQAALAILTGRAELAHSATIERRLLEASPRIGLVDGLHGKREPTADGLPTSVHLDIADLLEVVAARGVTFQRLLGDKGPVYEIERLAHFRKLMP